MKLQALWVMISSTAFSVFSQKPDAAIFSSGFEKNIFYNFCDSLPVRPIEVLLAFQYNNASPPAENIVQAFCQSMESKRFSKLKREKQIKEINNQVITLFLKKYEKEASFNDLFTTGNYNYVTASALYALVLDYFRIDYQILETPELVFLIADPQDSRFMMQTSLSVKRTIPQMETVYRSTGFDNTFKKYFAEYLLNNQYISQSEYKQNSIDLLFGKYYLYSKTINSLQLAALQYLNKGVLAYEAKGYEVAASNFEKAHILYPSIKTKFLLSNSLLQMLIIQGTNKSYNFRTLSKYVNINRSNNEALKISRDFFNEVAGDLLINRENVIVCQEYYQDFISALNDSTDKSVFTQVFHDLMAYYYYRKEDNARVLYHAAISSRINPGNSNSQDFVIKSLLLYLQRNNSLETIPLDSLIGFSKTFPFLLNQSVFQKILGYGFVRDVLKANRKSNQKQIELALKNLQQFSRKTLASNTGTGVMEMIYKEAAANLVRYYLYEPATTVLKSGLELIPESEVMTSELQHIIATVEEKKQSSMKSTNKPTVGKAPPEILSPPDYNAEEVLAGVKKYIINCWNVDIYKRNILIRDANTKQLKFIFYDNNRMKFKTGTEEQWGKWILNPSGPTITLTSNGDQERFVILLYETSENHMQGILAPNTTDNKRILFSTCD